MVSAALQPVGSDESQKKELHMESIAELHERVVTHQAEVKLLADENEHRLKMARSRLRESRQNLEQAKQQYRDMESAIAILNEQKTSAEKRLYQLEDSFVVALMNAVLGKGPQEEKSELKAEMAECREMVEEAEMGVKRLQQKASVHRKSVIEMEQASITRLEREIARLEAERGAQD